MEYAEIADKITGRMKALGILVPNMPEYELKAWMTMIVAEILQGEIPVTQQEEEDFGHLYYDESDPYAESGAYIAA